MYQVSIFNNNIETIIHYPTSDSEAPHLLKLNKKEKDSQADVLTFSIYINNPGYKILNEINTKIRIIDLRDNSIEFDGRVLDAPERMDGNGVFYKEVTCEGCFNYLIDTKTRKKVYQVQTPQLILTDLLNSHNSKVSNERKIFLGYVEITTSTTIQVSYQSTLSAILTIKDNLGGHFKIRVEEETRYLDYINTIDTDITIRLGENMKDILLQNDITDIGTRIIPLGKDELTIESVNNSIDYLDNTAAIAIYGVIEKVVEYKDIDNPGLLKSTALEEIAIHSTPKQILECSALDLSVLSNSSIDKFAINKSIRIINEVMGIDTNYSIVEVDKDLLAPYNPGLIISNSPERLSDKIIEFNNTTSLVNKFTTQEGEVNTYWLDGVINALKNQLVASGAYTNVQVVKDKGLLFENTNSSSSDFGALYLGPGIFAIANSVFQDGSWNWRTFGTGKGFTADLIVAGILKGVRIQQINETNGEIVCEIFKDSYGGKIVINDATGKLNARIGSETGRGSNVGGTMILYDDAPAGQEDDYRRVEAGISSLYRSGMINLRDRNNKAKASMYGDSIRGQAFILWDDNGYAISYLSIYDGRINNEKIATQPWVSSNYSPTGHYHSEFDGIGTNLNTLNSQVYDLMSRVSALENAGGA